MRWIFPFAGFCALGFLLGEPLLEGRNAHANLFAVYFKDPFLAFVYLGSVPFFVGLHRAYHGRWASARRCAFASAAIVALSFVFVPFQDREDRPQGIVTRAAVGSLLLAAGWAADRRARHVDGDMLS